MMNGADGQAKQKSNFSHMKTAILVINSLTNMIPHIREMKSELVKKFGFHISLFHYYYHLFICGVMTGTWLYSSQY